uniref:Mitoregulin n=1 Tax=Monodelphis domestica TaxID=13616 RepID=A0A5F8H295_MONDO
MHFSLKTKIIFFSSLPPPVADGGDRKLPVAVVVSFTSGFFVGWQACRLWRHFLNWWKERLQEQLQEQLQETSFSCSYQLILNL